MAKKKRDYPPCPECGNKGTRSSVLLDDCFYCAHCGKRFKIWNPVGTKVVTTVTVKSKLYKKGGDEK